MFPGANAQVYYNEDGEPLGWDYPSYDETAGCDPYDDYDEHPEAPYYVNGDEVGTTRVSPT